MKVIKTFESESRYELENEINKFLINEAVELVDIKYAVYGAYGIRSAIVIYKEKES